jgi:putative aminopeptidase FrvX
MTEQDKQRYFEAMHAMQSGVALKMNWDEVEASPKHLRVGMNSALVSNGALVKLLIDKGLISEDEFYKELADFAERDVASYQAEVNAHYGTDDTITLG